MSDPAFLAGLRVLEIGDGLAGAAAAATLASLGADVTTVADPRSTLRRARPSLMRGDGTEASLLSLLLDREKAVLRTPATTLAELEALVSPGSDGTAAGYDLIVADRVSKAPYGLAELGRAADYRAWVERVNRGAWVTISAFGLSGPRADDEATELTLSAATGLLSSVSDPATGQPLKLAGNQALLSSGQAAALAACQAIDRARDGRPVHLDVSAQEATIATGPMLALAQHLLNCGSSLGAKRYGAPASFYPCLDGLIRISAMEDHQWQGVVRAMGSPAWAQRFDDAAARIEFPEEIDEGIARWTANLTKADAETRMQNEGVPATAMYQPSEILRSPQLAYRGTLLAIDLGDGVTARAVGRPFLESPSAPAPSSGANPRGLRGLRVLEISHVLAVPLAAALLGALGAEVTKLEDVGRIDMYRRRGPYIDGEAGINRAAYFTMVNHSKSSVVVDPEVTTAPIARLAENADVLIENVGSRRLARLGLGEAYSGSFAEKLAVSSSGFGQDGPHAYYRAYAYNLQTSCGLGYLTRNESGQPAEIDLAWADLVSSYALATIVAAWATGPTRNAGRVLDFAMAELIDARFNEFLAAASIDPGSDDVVDRANAVSPFVPNGVYRTEDGWLAVSVDGDEAFAGLSQVLGLDAEVIERFASMARRQAERRELDVLLAGAFLGKPAGVWTETLAEHGVIAERVAVVRDLLDDAHLVERDFFVEVSHPEWGRRRLLGVPWREAGGRAIPLGHPPLFSPESSGDEAAESRQGASR